MAAERWWRAAEVTGVMPGNAAACFDLRILQRFCTPATTPGSAPQTQFSGGCAGWRTCRPPELSSIRPLR